MRVASTNPDPTLNFSPYQLGLLGVVVLGLVACGSEGFSSGEVGLQIDERPVARAATPPPPITGGTLLVTRDGGSAIASDPTRDLINLVDLETSSLVGAIELESGARPFRGAEDGEGRVHVTLRGTGEIAVVDVAAAALVSVVSICANPRGIAFSTDSNEMAVACAGGELVRYDATSTTIHTRTDVGRDLRDVVWRGDSVLVTRFRSAEVIEVDATGAIVPNGAPISVNVSGTLRAPNTAWRTVGHPAGGWVMLHQLANTAPLRVAEPGEPDVPDGGYAGGSTDAPPCSGASQPTVSSMRHDGTIVHGGVVPGVALAVDAALAPDGDSVVFASPSQHDPIDGSAGLRASLFRVSLRDFGPDPDAHCTTPELLDAIGEMTAVAFDGAGGVIAQSRDLPRLFRYEGKQVTEIIELAGDEIVDTGHSIFHHDAGLGLSCASCHPEGGDDGRVWSFAQHGPRRTQALDTGLEGTAPFHWRGEMTDMHMLLDEVRTRRMGGALQPEARATALREWVFSIPPVAPRRTAPDAQIAAGKEAFAKLLCDTCHSGPKLTSNGFADFGRGPLQIPNLQGVAQRAPFMHDGRSATLADATREMIALTPDAPPSTSDDVEAIVAYLESL